MSAAPQRTDAGDRPATIFLVAGEPSGDRLGARLMTALARSRADLRFVGVGGAEMEARGLRSLFPMRELSLMGFLEVLPHLPRLGRRLRQTTAVALAMRPDIVVTIDAPGFNMRLLKRLAGRGIPLIHYVAPTVWAWRPGRVGHFIGTVDRLLALLPFEPPYFERAGVRCSYVGHPALELSIAGRDPAGFRTRHGIPQEAPLLCMLPGSRRSELDRLLPVFGRTLVRLRAAEPRLHAVLPTVSEMAPRLRAAVAGWPDPPAVIEGEAARFDAFAAADLALAASGTVILELARFAVPTVLAYRANPISAMIARRLVRVRYAGLVNLLLDREAVPEFLQQDCTAERLAAALLALLRDPGARARQRADQAAAIACLGPARPSERAAAILLELLAAPPAGAAAARA